MTWGEGAKLGTEDMGIMAPSTSSLQQVYNIKHNLATTNFDRINFEAHMGAIDAAVPNVFTHLQPTLMTAWGDVLKATPIGSKPTFTDLITKSVDKFFEYLAGI